MPVRFNPPPGWPTPPGFTPTDQWHPDPSWPPAPPGWVFWTDDAAAASPPLPPPVVTVPPRRSMRDQGHDVVTPTAPLDRGSVPTQGSTHGQALTPAHVPAASSTMVMPAVRTEATYPPVHRPSGPTPVATPMQASAPRVAPVPSGPVGPLGLSVPAAEEGSEHGSSTESGGRRWLVPIIFGVAGVAVGLLGGLGVTMTAQAEAERVGAAAERIQEEAAAERSQIEAERAELEQLQAEVATAREELADREKAVASQESEISEARTALDGRASELDQRQSDLDQREQDLSDRDRDRGRGNGNGDGDDDGDDDGGWSWWGG
ncbi:hypothetical protein [Oerskovia flava]|uniref:hypothetical protein n=1 Tax=Oerskovia flava TaxID=2986422 RepID=UPI002240C9E0|nr:hypothetical protein [Oerskovia sp. JB1-3-2]